MHKTIITIVVDNIVNFVAQLAIMNYITVWYPGHLFGNRYSYLVPCTAVRFPVMLLPGPMYSCSVSYKAASTFKFVKIKNATFNFKVVQFYVKRDVAISMFLAPFLFIIITTKKHDQITNKNTTLTRLDFATSSFKVRRLIH